MMALFSFSRLRTSTRLFVTSLIALGMLDSTPAFGQDTDWGGPRGTLSVDDIARLIDERLAASNPYAALLNDPDPARSLAALQIMIESGDPDLRRLAIEFGLLSFSPEIRRAAVSSLLQADGELVFRIGPLDDLSSSESDNIRDRYGDALIISEDSVNTGSFCLFQTDANETCGAEDRISEVEGDLEVVLGNLTGRLVFSALGLTGEATDTVSGITFPIALSTTTSLTPDINNGRGFALSFVGSENRIVSIPAQNDLIDGNPVALELSQSILLEFGSLSGEPLVVRGVRFRSEPTDQQSHPRELVVSGSMGDDRRFMIGRYEFPLGATEFEIVFADRLFREVSIQILSAWGDGNVRIDEIEILTDAP